MQRAAEERAALESQPTTGERATRRPKKGRIRRLPAQRVGATDAELAGAEAPAAAAPPLAVLSEIRGDALLLKILWRRFKKLFDWRSA